MDKKKLIFIAIGIILFIALFFPGFSELQKLKKQNRNLEKRIEILRNTNKELKKEKEKLENDPTYVEKVAREKMGMTRRGEIILK